MTRYRFERWADGVSTNTRSIDLVSDASLEAIYSREEVIKIQITGTKEGCVVVGTEIDVSPPRTVNLSATKRWTGANWEVTVTAVYADDGSPADCVEISADGVSKGLTGVGGTVTFTV